VAIIGGGCAGILVAVHLLRLDRRPRKIVLFEPRAELGAGAAYSTDDPRHLLNAPAVRHERPRRRPRPLRGLAGRPPPGLGGDRLRPPTAVPHLPAGRLLDQAHSGAVIGTELTWVHELVTSLARGRGPGRPGDDRRTSAPVSSAGPTVVVLALGAPAPVALSGLDVSPTFGMVGDPWCPGALDATVDDPGDVLILGTGLTMIDVAMVLADQDRRRTVHARSRHGLLPAEHASDGFAPWPGFDIGQPTTAREVLLSAAPDDGGGRGGRLELAQRHRRRPHRRPRCLGRARR
jgi:hypothetical protein